MSIKYIKRACEKKEGRRNRPMIEVEWNFLRASVAEGFRAPMSEEIQDFWQGTSAVLKAKKISLKTKLIIYRKKVIITLKYEEEG